MEEAIKLDAAAIFIESCVLGSIVLPTKTTYIVPHGT